MGKKIEYSFDDEHAVKFCYDIERKVMEVHFSGYYDLNDDKSIEDRCILVIKEWDSAQSQTPLFGMFR